MYSFLGPPDVRFFQRQPNNEALGFAKKFGCGRLVVAAVCESPMLESLRKVTKYSHGWMTINHFGITEGGMNYPVPCRGVALCAGFFLADGTGSTPVSLV